MIKGIKAAIAIPDTICTVKGNLSRPVTILGIINIPRIAP
jgi:hypothetical protein